MSSLDRTVRDVMTSRPTCVRPDERLDIALALMTACRIRHLPVEEDGEVLGILALRDVYRVDRSRLTSSRAERAMHLRAVEVQQVMTRPVITADPTTPVLEAAQLLLERHVSSLPVVEEGRLQGILTRTDLLGVAADQLHAEVRPHAAPVTVSRLMTPSPLVTVGPDDGLDVAHTLMRTQRMHHLPVVTDGRLVGLLSDLDLLGVQSSSLEPLSPADRLAERHWTKVCDAMSPRVVTIAPDDCAADAAHVLQRRHIGCLPVVRAGRLTGILTVTDYFYYLLSHLPERHVAVAHR